MEESNVYEALTELFRDIFGDDSIVLTPDTSADDIDAWDSLSNIQMVLAVERCFNIRLSAAQVSSLSCLGDLVGIILQKTQRSVG